MQVRGERGETGPKVGEGESEVSLSTFTRQMQLALVERAICPGIKSVAKPLPPF